MANQPEVTNYDTGVYQWETTDAAEGGVGGKANAPLLNLANRTNWLKAQITELQSSVRTIATGNITLYVATTGSDGNPGTSAAPFLTLQHAINVLWNTYDLDGYTGAIKVADGTYTAGADFLGVPLGAPGAITITGDTSLPDNCVINVTNGSCFVAFAGANVVVQGFKLQATGTGIGQGVGLYTSGPSVITYNNIDFGACAIAHKLSFGAGLISSISASFTVSGSSGTHAEASEGGNIVDASPSVVIVGAPAFATAFAVAYDGCVNMGGATFSGSVSSVTGTRYIAIQNGVIITNGGGANFFPGNAAGSNTGGGQYS